jgi:hypothetical protein
MIPYFFITSVNALLGCWLGTVLTRAVIRWIIGFPALRSSFKFNLLLPLLCLVSGIAISCVFYDGILNLALLSGSIGFVLGFLVGSLIGKASLPFA